MNALTNMHKAARICCAWCVLFALAACSSSAWAQAGFVHQVSGLVSIQREPGKTEPMKVGDTFNANTAFRTGADGKLTLKFADGQVVAMGPDTAVSIGQYRYDPGSASLGSSTVVLTQGEMRFVAGLIGTASSTGVRLMAGDSVISMGPGGADFTMGVKPGAQESGYTVVAFGEITARTPYGQVSKIAAGQYAPWQPGRSLPLPMPFAAAPAVIQASVAALWVTILPASTPVAVAAAARTAAAVAAPAQATADATGDRRLAGYVAATSNSVSIRTATGGRTAPGVGATFQAGAAFSTGADGVIALKVADGQIVVLGSGSNLAVAQYDFDPGNVKTAKSAIDLVNGTMRIVTGTIHEENREGISISAGASIVEILNNGPADFDVAVNTTDEEVGIVRVTLGEVAVRTPYGAIDRVKAGESAPWGPRKTLTNSPSSLTAGLALVQSILGLQLPGLPDNAPVDVALAATAAAAAAEANRAQAVANANPANAQLQAAAQGAAQLADLATRTANAASESIAAKIVATTLENLTPTAAGPALAQVAAGPGQAQATAARSAGLPPPFLPIIAVPGVTPGAGGGGCLGSPC